MREPEVPMPLPNLLLTRLVQLGDGHVPMSLAQVVERSGRRIDYDRLRGLIRGERADILTVGEVDGLAVALEIPADTIANVVTVLPDL